MIFLSVIIVFVLVQWWGLNSPFHNDRWFRDWHDRMKHVEFLTRYQGLVFAATVLGPVILLVAIIAVVGGIAHWLLILVFVPVLLYSIGRGEFAEPTNDYLFAWNSKDWEKALENYILINRFSNEVDESSVNVDFEYGDWTSLNHAMLKSVAYKGFEKFVTVFFWFVLIGPIGPLIYRLVSLFITHEETEEHEQARRWLWLLEWPAVRVLGLTFALTGSFVGCIRAWQEKLLCAQSTTQQVLEHYIHGALDVDEAVALEDAITESEFKAVLSLYKRTIIFWICVLAILTVLM